jgi:hypothetical protein
VPFTTSPFSSCSYYSSSSNGPIIPHCYIHLLIFALLVWEW